jgi:hypothetical protein
VSVWELFGWKKESPPEEAESEFEEIIPSYLRAYANMVKFWEEGDIFEFMHYYLMINRFEMYNQYSGTGRNCAWCLYRDDTGVLREVRISAEAMCTDRIKANKVEKKA